MNFFDVLYNQKYQAKRGAYPDRLFGSYTQPVVVTTEKAPIVSFDDGGNNAPMLSLVADIGPIQSGTPNFYGTEQTPYFLKAIGSGNTEDMSKIVGGTVAWNQLQANTVSRTTSGVTFAYDNGNLTISTASGGATGTAWWLGGTDTKWDFYNNHVYLVVIGGGYSRVSGYSWYIPNVPGYSAIYIENEISIIKMTGDRNIYLQCQIGSGIEVNGTYTPQVIDLTQMFGTTIADYAYSLEQAEAGSGIAWLKQNGWFTKPYYPYNAGTLESVKTGDSVTVGFNQWDEEWEVGNIDDATGQNNNNVDTLIRSKNYTPALPGTVYYANIATKNAHIFCYDADYNYLGYLDRTGNGNFTTKPNTSFIRFRMNTAYGNTYNNDICINLSKTTGTPKNGDYVAYTSTTYPLDSSLTLRGIPKLDASNNLYYDGDEYLPSGSVNRRYGIVDLGSLSWTRMPDVNSGYYTDTIFKATLSQAGMISRRYNWVDNGQYIADGTAADLSIGFDLNGRLRIKDLAYTSQADFKASLSGNYLVYELPTSTTETATPYQGTMPIVAGGTEQFIGSPIPVGNSSTYHDVFPISGRTEVRTVREGKNLFDASILENKDFGGTSSTTNVSTAGYLPIKGGETYMWSQSMSFPGRYIRFYDAEYNQVGSTSQYNAVNATITTPSNAVYYRMMWYKAEGLTVADVTNAKVQLEYGSTATAYEPYLTPLIITTQLGQTVYGGTLDVVSGVLTVDRGIRTFADLGADSRWNKLSSGTGAFYMARTVALPDILYPFGGQSKYYPISTEYRYSASGTMTDGTMRVSDALYIVDNRFENVASFQAYLRSSDGKFVYTLATPITIQLTPTEVRTLLGTNNIWSDSGEVQVAYQRIHG